MQPRFAHHTSRLGGTEILCHHALIHTQPPQCPVSMHLNSVSHVKTYFFCESGFQTATGKILVLPFVQGRSQSKHVLPTGNNPGADENAVPTSAILKSILKWQ